MDIASDSHQQRFFPRPLDDRKMLGDLNETISQLAIKTASLAPHFTTPWMMDHLKLPHRVVDEILWQLKDEKLVEMLGQLGPLNYRFRITSAGLELASRLMDICGYVGPAPVSLEEYSESVKAQRKNRCRINLDQVKKVTADLVLPRQSLEIATLALSARRSLFMFGPPGNGKSSLGRSLHRATSESIWIPHAIAVDNQVIRLFDPEYHHAVYSESQEPTHDQRWIHIDQPFVMSGGELTMEQLDLVFDRSLKYYEAPPHLKANCGTYFIDDLGRQRVDSFDLLNRWIVPLEQGIDFLSMVNGKKIDVPFQMMLVVATNLQTEQVSDPAFLRRMGYRIYLGNPSDAEFRLIFERQADQYQLELEDGILDYIIDKYQSESRPWRASEPRDLLGRCRDVIALRQLPDRVDREVVDLAWAGYFSNEPSQLAQ